MKKTILIVGNSQLSFFVAKQLGKLLGDHVHIDIVWLNTTKSICPATHKDFDPKKHLSGVRVATGQVKSINLRDRRVVTGQKTYEYDLALIDQTPVFTSFERDKITDQLETLVSTVHSNENRGVASRAKVSFAGNDYDSLSLALQLNQRKNRDSSAAVGKIRVEVESPGKKVADFLKNTGISTKKSLYPGIQIKKPLPIIASKAIRGLRVDLAGWPMTMSTLEPINNQSALVVGYQDRASQNIARSDWQLAKQLVTNLLAKVEGGLEQPIETDGSRLLITNGQESFVELGKLVSGRNRAKLIAGLDRQFWKKLLS